MTSLIFEDFIIRVSNAAAEKKEEEVERKKRNLGPPLAD